HVSSATQNQALNALVFLYSQVLEIAIGDLSDALRAKKPVRLPVVLTKTEVDKLLAQLDGTYSLIVSLLYGTGMRLLEGLRVRVKDNDLGITQLVGQAGKGPPDPVTMLPGTLKEPLRAPLERVKARREADLRDRLGTVYLPEALERKYPTAN